MKVLVIRFSSIGDIVLTTPVLRILKTQIENLELHYCTKKAFSSILDSNPYVDKVLVLEDSLWSLLKIIRSEKYDYVLDLHNNLRSSLIKLALPLIPTSTFRKENFQKWLIVKLKFLEGAVKHVTKRYIDVAKPLGVVDDLQGLEFYIPHKDEVELNWLGDDFKAGYYALVIGGQHSTKKLPYQKLIELCDKIHLPIVIVGGKEDQEIGGLLENHYSHTSKKNL